MKKENNKKGTLQKVLKVSKWIFASVFVLCISISITVYLMRDKIVDKVVTELNKNMNTPVQVESIDLTFWASFPNLSVDFNKLYIKDAVPDAQETDTLFYSERVRLKFNPFDILKKEYKVKKIEVSPGYAHIKNFKEGRNNYDIVKTSEDTTSSSFEFSLKEVAFENFRLDYSNYDAEQYQSTELKEMVLSGDFTEKLIDLNVESTLHINYAQSGKVKLVTHQTAHFDFNLLVNKEDGSVLLKEAPVTIADLPFSFALTVQPNLIDVRLKAKDLQLVQLAQSLHHQGTDKIKDFQGTGKVQFDLHYSDKRVENKKGEIECVFGIQNGNIVEPSKNLRISNINIDGYYGNVDKRNGEHLNLKELQFRTAAGPFKGNLLLTKFNKPRYQGKANGRIDLAVLHCIFPIPTVKSTSGKVNVDSKFDIQTTGEGVNLSACSGDLDFQNVHCQLNNDKRYFDHITGGMLLNSNVLDIQQISLTVGKSDLLLNGKLEQIQNYLNKKGNLLANMDVKSAYIDVQDFSSSDKAEEIKNGRNFILPNDIVANVQLRANNLQYEKHQFKQLGTNLKINGRNLNFTALRLQNAGAEINGNVLIQENSPEIFTISTEASSNNIAFQPLFSEWDNFDQQVISSQNISGSASANLKFTAPFDLRSGINSNQILATLDLQVDNGKLTNVEAFKSISGSLQSSTATRLILKENNITTFEKNLLDLKFETLKNTITIANGKLTIPKMTIASNALTVDLAGTHDFNNNIDYHFNFNLRDIKKVKVETEFGEVVDDGTGLLLFCHMYGNLDNPTIKWDKEQKRLLAKETFQQEKQTTKEMLKAELGMFKKDTSVVAYKAKEKPKETIQMQFGAAKKEEPIVEEKVNKNTKINKTLQKWKEDAKKEKEGELVLDPE